VFGRFDTNLDDWCMNLDYNILSPQLTQDVASGGIKNFAFVSQSDGVVSNVTMSRSTAGSFLQLCAHVYVHPISLVLRLSQIRLLEWLLSLVLNEPVAATHRPDNYCAEFLTCSACMSSPQCGWCGASKTCLLGNTTGQDRFPCCGLLAQCSLTVLAFQAPLEVPVRAVGLTRVVGRVAAVLLRIAGRVWHSLGAGGVRAPARVSPVVWLVLVAAAWAAAVLLVLIGWCMTDRSRTALALCRCTTQAAFPPGLWCCGTTSRT
jgi:hypothetical protein